MEKIDREVFQTCKMHSVSCTRYADDITLPADQIEKLVVVENLIRKIVATSKRPRLEFNDNKRGIFTSAGRQIVTGLILTPDGKISMGRDRKR